MCEKFGEHPIEFFMLRIRVFRTVFRIVVAFQDVKVGIVDFSGFEFVPAVVVFENADDVRGAAEQDTEFDVPVLPSFVLRVDFFEDERSSIRAGRETIACVKDSAFLPVFFVVVPDDEVEGVSGGIVVEVACDDTADLGELAGCQPFGPDSLHIVDDLSGEWRRHLLIDRHFRGKKQMHFFDRGDSNVPDSGVAKIVIASARVLPGTMSHPGATGRPPTDIGPDEETINQLRAVLDETRLRLLQQILAYDDGALSVEELDYRNTDLKKGTIDYHLRQLADHNVVRKLRADNPENDLPSTYWAVTERGVELLKRLGFYDEIAALSEADDALERTDRIRDIEAFPGRPEPDWY